MAKRVDLRCPHNKKEIVCDESVNPVVVVVLYATIQKCVKAMHCTP